MIANGYTSTSTCRLKLQVQIAAVLGRLAQGPHPYLDNTVNI